MWKDIHSPLAHDKTKTKSVELNIQCYSLYKPAWRWMNANYLYGICSAPLKAGFKSLRTSFNSRTGHAPYNEYLKKKNIYGFACIIEFLFWKYVNMIFSFIPEGYLNKLIQKRKSIHPHDLTKQTITPIYVPFVTKAAVWVFTS